MAVLQAGLEYAKGIKLKIVFMGTPDFAVGTLKKLIESRHEVLAVVTQPDKPKGRGKAMQFPPVKEVAEKAGIPVYQPKKVRDPEFLEILKELSPDVVVVVAFGQIIPQAVLDVPRLGCLNVHGSLLPKYRGAAPIQWAVIDGEKESGVTIMRMDAGLDTGDMITTREVELEKKETGGSLFDKLSQAGAELLIETLDKLESGQVSYEKQPAESSTDYARMLKKEDGQIDWKKSAAELERLIRGLNPWPSAYTHLDGKTLKIWMSDAEEGNSGSAPGTVAEITRNSVKVQTGDGMLSLLEVQLEGKKKMPVDAFLRGCQLAVGSLLS